jgi:hypothetical protein
MPARLALLLCLLLAASPAIAAAPSPQSILRRAIALGCEAPPLGPAAMAARLPGARLESEAPLPSHGPPIGWRRRFALGDGGALVIDRLAPKDVLEQIVAEYAEPRAGGPRPRLAALAGAHCAIEAARRMRYDAQGRQAALELLDKDFAATGQEDILTAPVPPGTDPGGTTVALVDTGVNYLLPEIAARLARDGAGRALGYDYWAMDDQPFDRQIVLSPFFPQRHGTLVASVLLAEAPAVRLIPYRYPRPAMARFAALLDDAAAKGARIVSLSLGSDDRAEWESFAAAAARHPELLIVVSAGNDGRDLDRAPVYPAALPLANKLAVTAADAASGLPAPGANWGARSVDLAVPAEDVRVIGFDGLPGTASGSSFAAPRIAALAARLLLRHPEWRTPALKAAILARARPVSRGGARLLAAGYIADPSASR